MGMGQVSLGFRSLAIKLAVFFVMAALLAWALGGTLWPRPHVAHEYDSGAMWGDDWYFWQISLDERRPQDNRAHWQLMIQDSAYETRLGEVRTWSAAAGPIAVGDGIHFGGRNDHGQWFVVHMDRSGAFTDFPMPDRLAVEQQLARLQAGLPLQTVDEILAQRPSVLDPSIPRSN